jgi:hypothetical protein
MNAKKTLESFAESCLQQYSEEDIDDIWVIFRDEARAMYSAEDDGDLADYEQKCFEIFDRAVECSGDEELLY